jgi:hypothetical protein
MGVVSFSKKGDFHSTDHGAHIANFKPAGCCSPDFPLVYGCASQQLHSSTHQSLKSLLFPLLFLISLISSFPFSLSIEQFPTIEECLSQSNKIIEAHKYDDDFKRKPVSKELLQLIDKSLVSHTDDCLFSLICLTIDTALRQPATWPVPEQINSAYVQQVCTPRLAKALCTIVGMGRDFASSGVFAALRYCVDSADPGTERTGSGWSGEAVC